MKLRCFFLKDEKTEKAKEVFKQTVSSFVYNWKLDELDVIFCRKDLIRIKEKKGIIYIDTNNPFIESGDELGMKAIFLERIMELILASHEIIFFEDEDPIAKEFLIDRLLVEKFGDIIFHKNLRLIINTIFNNLSTWIDANFRCMVFHKIDEWSKEYLKRVIERKNENNFPLLFHQISFIVDKFDESMKERKDFEEAMKKILSLKREIELRFAHSS